MILIDFEGVIKGDSASRRSSRSTPSSMPVEHRAQATDKGYDLKTGMPT